jgi:phytoene dehydrogenase-like protein
MENITIVGGGLAGLVAAIECAGAGATVELREASERLGGRARSTTGPFVANLGPHVVYDDGPLWAWLHQRGLAEPAGRTRPDSIRFRVDGRSRRVPPAAVVAAIIRLRRRRAPVDLDARTWYAAQVGVHTAELLCRAAGVFTFDHDPGRLSAAFVHERLVRVTKVPPHARYLPGGWTTMIDRLATQARRLGVEIRTGDRVEALPPPPVVVAVPLRSARRLIDDEALRWEGARTVLLDVGLRRGRPRGPFIVSDLDQGGWVECFSRPDPSLAPTGHELVQAQLGLRPDESLDDGLVRMEGLLDTTWPGWREREVWRRRSVVTDSSGAIDRPGTTWRDRPAIDRGGGVFLAGDAVAAPGLLSEVAAASAVTAAVGAVAWAGERSTVR